MFSNPYVYQTLDQLLSMPVVQHVCTLSSGFLKSMSIIDMGIVSFDNNDGHELYVAKILCGTLAGCGGSLWIGKCTHIKYNAFIY
jgi:hypothetical protein